MIDSSHYSRLMIIIYFSILIKFLSHLKIIGRNFKIINNIDKDRCYTPALVILVQNLKRTMLILSKNEKKTGRLGEGYMGKINCKSYDELPDDWRNLYPTKCPIPTRSIRVLLIEETVITRPTNKRNRKKNKNTTLRPLYDGPLPLKKAKLIDLLHLKQFLTNPDARKFYAALKSDETDRDGGVKYADNIPIDKDA
ncbi:hypothetical protein QTP88_015171 [Uroleucon formosanum]